MDHVTGNRRLLKIDLMEISVVTFPANPLARVRAAKSAMEAGELPQRAYLQKAL